MDENEEAKKITETLYQHNLEITAKNKTLSLLEKLYQTSFILHTLRDRSDLLKQLAGQIIFSYGSLEKFWQLFMGAEAARRTSCALATAQLGYYVLIAKKSAPKRGDSHG